MQRSPLGEGWGEGRLPLSTMVERGPGGEDNPHHPRIPKTLMQAPLLPLPQRLPSGD